MKKLVIALSFFCLSDRLQAQEIPMDTVKVPIRNKRLAEDTVRFEGEVIERGDGFLVIDQQDTTVIGIAWDTKGGAMIVVDKKSYYFIDKLDTWPKEVLQKRVKVTGRCIVYDYRELMRSNPLTQGYIYMKVLRDARWEVVE